MGILEIFPRIGKHKYIYIYSLKKYSKPPPSGGLEDDFAKSYFSASSH